MLCLTLTPPKSLVVLDSIMDTVRPTIIAISEDNAQKLLHYQAIILYTLNDITWEPTVLTAVK